MNFGNHEETGGGGFGESVTDEEVLPINDSHRYGLTQVYRNPAVN